MPVTHGVIAVGLVFTTAFLMSAHAPAFAEGIAPSVQDPLPVPAAVAAQTEPSASRSISVLERFRTHAGPRTPSTLCELFKAPVSSGFRQQPEIALSSGAVSITIAAALNPANSTAPNFAFNGARLISSAQATPDQWLIEALPETGVWKAEMIVLTDSAVTEVPLVVAPPLPAGTDLSEKGFIAFLGGKEPAAQSLRDLNGDGRRDYLDDYIYTANYLVRQRSGPLEPDSAAPAAPEEHLGDQDNGQPEPVAGTNPPLQSPATIQGTVSQSPVGGQSGSPTATATSSRFPADKAVDRKTYNSLTYDQKRKLREELARKNKLLVNPQGQ